ncbi:hypothetical protein ABK040_006743 [Willaertia magna]
MNHLVCHICGENFTLENLSSHLLVCSSEWNNKQKKLPSHLQRVYPPRGPPSLMLPESIKDTQQFTKYNLMAKCIFIQESLNPCPDCLTLFTADDLLLHNCSTTKLIKEKPKIQISLNEERPSTSNRTFDIQKQNTSSNNNNNSTTRKSITKSPSLRASNEMFSNGTANQQDVQKFLPKRDSSPQYKKSPKKSMVTRSLNGKPLGIYCHLCGREYLTVESLYIHIPQCIDKRKASQLELPKEMRTKAPSPPTLTIPVDKDAEDFLQRLEDYNNEAYRIYEQSSRVSCKYCGRRFSPESLIVHLRGCEKQAENKQYMSNNSKIPSSKNTIGSSNSGGNAIESNYNDRKITTSSNTQNIESQESNPSEKDERIACKCCGRKFSPDRIQRHEAICKK